MTYGNLQGYGTPQQDPEPKKKSRKMLWIGCGVAVFLFFCMGTIVLVGSAAWWGSQNDAPVSNNSDTSSDDGSSTTSGENTSASNAPPPFLAVVQIRAQFYENGRLVTGWTGSGSIISPDGYILTNAHVVLPDKYFPIDALVIALTIAEDREPVELYYAEVMQADVNLDLAVLRIVQEISGREVGPADLDLPYVELGNSDDLHLGDDIVILGYPGIGGDTITLTGGEISGFTAEAPYGDRAFIKTSATIAGGNSGGLAVGPDGRIIGVPTQLGYGGDDQFVDCRVLADTNRDGVVNDNDSCIPTGGFINALRPINLAFPYIEAAQRGETNIIEEVDVQADVEIPEPDSGEGTVLLEDDFSTPGGVADWTAGDRGGNGYARYINDEFQINVVPDNYFIWSTAKVDFSDLIMSINVRVVRATGQGDYGFICRYQDVDNFYGLEITENGYYGIWMYNEGEYSVLLDWTHSTLIPQDGDWHTLSAACVDNYLVLAVNGDIIAEVQDDTFSSGDIGLVAGTWKEGNMTISFDDLYVTSP